MQQASRLFPGKASFMDMHDTPAIPAAPEASQDNERAGKFIEDVIELCERVLQNANTQHSSC
ncbi:MAG TPA: hypothetical protein VKT33_08380 [Candidatus Angelobacter sp.]|nr:hypothetical protein [Candidatus Angelobacter sp.]